MSKATFTFGRFSPPTQIGHGTLISAVQNHAESTGGQHYIFPSHTQDNKKNPLSHEQKVGFMRRMFPSANVVSNDGVRTAIDAMKHLESKGHTHVTMVVGSDRVDEFNNLLNKYREKEYPGIKKISVVSAGNRDPDAEGAEGMSASKMRGLVAAGKRDEFISHYSDPKLGAELHDAVKAGMEAKPKKLEESVAIFLLGGPGSGKDYIVKNIFSRFDLMEVHIDQVITGSAKQLFEQGTNVVINGGDLEKIQVAKMMLEGYTFDHVFVSVTNKVSRNRNAGLRQPLAESKRIDKFLKAQKMAEAIDEVFVFNNSINLNESNDIEKLFFANQIEKLLERIINLGLEMKEIPEPKVYTTIKEKVEPKKFAAIRHDRKSGLPSKYVKGLTRGEIAAKKAHIEKNKGLSDRDPEAYKDMPGDKRIREKGIPQSNYTTAFHKKFGEEVELDEAASDKSLSAKAEKSGVSLATLRKVYNRGVAAWNSGHRPGTTPQQWGHARVNSYIMKGKTYHTADKDLHEETEELDEHIVKVDGKFRLVSKSTGKNLGTYDTKAGAEKRERQVQYFKHMGEDVDVPLPLVLPKEKHAPVKRGYREVIQQQKANLAIAKQSGLIPEMQLIGTDEYRQHAIAMTPGQDQEIEDVTTNMDQNQNYSGYESDEGDCGCGCGGSDCGSKDAQAGSGTPKNARNFRQIRQEAKEAKEIYQSTIIPNPVLITKKKESRTVRSSTGLVTGYNTIGAGLPVTNFSELPSSAISEEECNDDHAIYHEFAQHCCDHLGLKQEQIPKLYLHDDPEWTTQNGTFGHYTPGTNTINLSITGRHPMDIMRTLAHEMTHAAQHAESPLPPEAGETGSDWENHANAEAGIIMRKWRDVNPQAFKALMESATLFESVQYHLENNISFTENAFRPGSKMFFNMISEAKRLYAEGKYTPADDYEKDLLESNIGEKAIYEGKEVILDFPFQETLNEDDETGGHGIGKPFRSHGGGAVYVKNSNGNVIKVNFSQSGMKKRFNEPARVRSFVARHHCLTNKDRTSASYWACRWPRYFSNTGQQWW